jgi:hypothetical protein
MLIVIGFVLIGFGVLAVTINNRFIASAGPDGPALR